MDNENQPLLTVSPEKLTQNGNSSDSSSSGISNDPTGVRIPIYGTTRPIAKIISSEERITYTWKEINVFADLGSSQKKFAHLFHSKKHQAERKHILKNVCGVAYPGELLAILGSSGAGKTTLLNALTFQTPSNVTVSGIRCVNGIPITSKQLITQSAYVQQDDLFIGNLTVKEQLIFHALVRMDRDISHSQRMQRVDEVILELGLAKCQNTQIGIIGRIKGISGGEKKRLAFASEVLTNPKLMFCDEPTSGLDSFMALNIVQVLKSMTMSGKTVICTIHQPSSELFAMFDKLLLMAEGRIAFLGSPEEAYIFFKELESPCPKNYNPADFYVQLLAIIPEKEESSRQAVNLISDKFEKSAVGIKVCLEAGGLEKDSGYHDVWFNGDNSSTPYKASWWAQFKAVLWRSWLTVMKEPILIKVRIIQTIVIALIIGSMYYGQTLNMNGVMNINGVLFVFLTNMTFQNVFAVLNVFCTELPIFLREHRNGMYRTDVYFLCKTLAECPIFIVMPVILTSVCYFMIGLNADGSRFFVACGILVLVANVATSFGYMVSCAAPNISVAFAAAPSLIVPFLLFGGFFLNVGSIPIYFQWLSYLSWFRYGNAALMINQWFNVTGIECPSENSACPKDGHIVLEIFNFKETDFTLDLIMLGVLILGFRLVAYFSLLAKTYQRK